MKAKISLFWHAAKLSLGVAACLVVPLTAAPVHAASTPPPTPGVTFVDSASSAQVAFASLPAPTAAQMTAARAWLAAHPKMEGSIVELSKPKSGTGTLSPTPYVSVSVNWWGIRLHLTQNDVHNIWDLVWAAGIGAAAAVLCSPGLWLSIACAIAGAVIAYIVAELIWNYIGYWVPGCGVHIDYYWWGRYGYGNC
jgi:hypothetical protein